MFCDANEVSQFWKVPPVLDVVFLIIKVAKKNVITF